MILIHPTYFPTILSYALLTQSGEKILFEVSDYYEKQTYRSRMYIHSANGKQSLSVQVKHTHSDGKQIYKDVLISNDFDWQKQHWRSLETAYRTSPYFEYYEDDLFPVFHKKFKYLLDLNLQTIESLNNLLELDFPYQQTAVFQKEHTGTYDFRYLKNAKKQAEIVSKFPVYTQMFEDRNGFMPNLSILDLLFMEGPNATTYLKEIYKLVDITGHHQD